jgi:hypothetical protein
MFAATMAVNRIIELCMSGPVFLTGVIFISAPERGHGEGFMEFIEPIIQAVTSVNIMCPVNLAMPLLGPQV